MLTVVTGGPDVGAAFSALPFDHIFFTGSPAVGASVARTAGGNLVPVTLELGGKNPAVVGRDADIREAAVRIMSARLANGGQLCLCPEYAFVPTERVDEFVAAAHNEGCRAARVDNGLGLVSIVNERNFDRVSGLIDDARSRGAVVTEAPGGHDRDRRRIPPTILQSVDDTMRINAEEVFGPVLAVHTYDDIDEVIDYVSNRPTPLAAYWFGPKGADAREFRRRVASGGMTINDFALHCAVLNAPFGGLGRSGSGAYHGKTGFDTFSHHRTVTSSRLPLGMGSVMTPPYSAPLKRGLQSYIALQRRNASRRLARAARIKN